jgi:L-cystine uptake protein TcyP (sodium:dicarboxylate symporter family)
MSESIITDGTEYHVTCTALITLCSMALFFMLLSWVIGGDEYKDILLGDYVIPLLILGIVAGMVLKIICRRREQEKS